MIKKNNNYTGKKRTPCKTQFFIRGKNQNKQMDVYLGLKTSSITDLRKVLTYHQNFQQIIRTTIFNGVNLEI